MPERKKVLLRLDPAVYDAVARWAADDLRSVNAQLEYALRLALRGAGRDIRRDEREPAGRDDVTERDNANEPDKSSD
ncbi:hypothetical protein FHR32_003507 [Streptosporangium album]|uniref:Toxin-antitoxin system HicB family antitoxin n=1 Tax=Streptosporangium album TaxID=47479 RepID=A0A7W7RWG6_9ACTN|nr:hypothetical protein [Streptosporangium album]MBB4939202.1 hypothetical protein [Streptosporangium album]